MATGLRVRVAACAVLLSGLAAPTAAADPVTLPAMTPTNAGPVIGGGGGGQLAQQLATLGNPSVQEVDGNDAAAFINAAASTANPQLSAPFSLLRRALNCQNNNAGFAARAFRRNDGLWGGAMLVAGKTAKPDIEALTTCAKTNWRRANAGNETSMCNSGWNTPTSFNSRGGETYYIMLAGTASDFCVALNGKYKENASGWPT